MKAVITAVATVFFLTGCATLSGPSPEIRGRMVGYWRYYRPIRDRRFGPKSRPVFLTLSPSGNYTVVAVSPAAKRLPGGKIVPTQFFWDAAGTYRLAGDTLKLLMPEQAGPTAELALVNIPGFDRKRRRVECTFVVDAQTLTLASPRGEVSFERVAEDKVPVPAKRPVRPGSPPAQ